MAKRKRILYAEDNPSHQQIMTKWLSDYEVVVLDNPDDAYEFAAKAAHLGEPVDLFLLDITLYQKHDPASRREWVYHDMPIDQGIALAKLLRKIPDYEDTPIIFLSAKLKLEEHREKLANRVRAICLQKPVPYARLQELLTDLLGTPEKGTWQKLASWIGWE